MSSPYQITHLIQSSFGLAGLQFAIVTFLSVGAFNDF